MKWKRLGAYLIDYTFVILLATLIAQIHVINPYYDNYQAAYEKYEEVISDVNVNNSLSYIKSSEYASNYHDVIKYGSVISSISIVCTLLYFVGFQKWNKGQTLGKKMFGLKLVNDEGENPSLLAYILRTVIIYNVLINMLIIILAFLCKGLVFVILSIILNFVGNILVYGSAACIFLRKDNKGLHDIIAKTNVVDA